MLMMVAAAATWFCFPGSSLCYDTSKVSVKEHQVATVIMEIGIPQKAIIVIDCDGKTHTVTDGKMSASDKFEEGSVADLLCKMHLKDF